MFLLPFTITYIAVATAAGLGVCLFDLYLTTAVLHRGMTHGAIRYPRWVERIVAGWLWATVFIPSLTWIAAHKHHHAHSDTPADPHSPKLKGVWNVLLLTWLHVPRWARQNQRYAEERYLQRFRQERFLHFLDGSIACAVNFWGQIAASVVAGPALMAFWVARTVPYMLASGYVNAIGHTYGTRAFENLGTDAATAWQRILGYVVGGETLGHNFHHRFTSSATFRPRRFDPGFWFAVRILQGTPVAFATKNEE